MKARISCLSGGLLLLALVLAGCNLFFPPSTPQVTVDPSTGVVNSRITILGAGFGATQGTSEVTLDGVPASILAWSDTRITARVPLLATPGGGPDTVSVIVTAGGRAVGRADFTVTRGILYCAWRAQETLICLANPDPDVSESFDLASSAGGISPNNWPQWSPDGTKVLFVRGLMETSEIYVVNADGTHETRLTSNSAYDWFPTWSPDGTRIAFQTTRDGNWEVYVMDADGFGQTNLSQYGDIDAWPSWSPDGMKIAFYRLLHLAPITGEDTAPLANGATDYEVLVMSADGTGQTDISDHQGTDWYPLWSPNGGSIAFQSDRDGAGEIFTMSPDGSGQTNLTHNPALDGATSWSPDGTQIAFVSSRDGDYEIYVMNADGSGLRRLTSSPGWDAGPSWSPDGSQIAFESFRDGDYRVYVMDSDGSHVRRLSDDTSMYPVWMESRWLTARPPV